MLPCLWRVMRPAFSLTAGRRLSRAGHRNTQPPAVVSGSTGRLASQLPLVQRCYLGTHPLKEPVEPLNSPSGAKDFIYSLHPSERSCLLRELHKFESIAIAQVWFIGSLKDLYAVAPPEGSRRAMDPLE
ncbi:hypothetical protein ILYODFUR_019719 [Ilyodon furcidens]|uniref:Uncharacterized protein n=1 Tax=Ilyodon furcidens TaxID=33524 RepID=A0ABV0UUL6_9TELE